MQTKDYIEIAVLFLSPIIAVLLTIWYQNRQSRRFAKMNLFIDLVSFRHHIPLPWQYTVALNRIDVIFHKQNDIRHLWHEYYDLICKDQILDVPDRVNEKKIALISRIANHLGYNNIDQIFLQRYYQTKGSYDQIVGDNELKTELLRVLKSTDTLFLLNNKIDETKNVIVDGKVQKVQP
jgi:Family of unknown function (DUF6680)